MTSHWSNCSVHVIETREEMEAPIFGLMCVQSWPMTKPEQPQRGQVLRCDSAIAPAGVCGCLQGCQVYICPGPRVDHVRSKFIPYKIYTYTVSLFIMIKGNEGL